LTNLFLAADKAQNTDLSNIIANWQIQTRCQFTADVRRPPMSLFYNELEYKPIQLPPDSNLRASMQSKSVME
jgi:hypothetical protein